jgi:hypothetical protein
MVPWHALTVEEIINRFPNPVLPKIDHEPTFEDIQVATSMGGVRVHRHLGTIMTKLEYDDISGTPWAEPLDPGPIPIMADGANPVDASQLALIHDEFRGIHTNRINVDQALKRIILEVCNNMYTSQLEDYLLQYANHSALEIVVHLKSTYGFINTTQLADNYNKMTAPINFQDSIQALFTHIEDGVRYTNPGMQPYTEAQYVNIAFLLILNTGAVPEACREWQHRTPVNQTWAFFTREFARAQRKQGIISNTASGAGYHTANVNEHYVHGQLPHHVGFFTAMANLATTTSADRETVAALTKEIVAPTDQLAARDAWGRSKEAEIKRLVSMCTITGATYAATPGAPYVRKSSKNDNDNYCWSHGYQVGQAHTSNNCTKKAHDHKDEATKDNIMGGDTWDT